MNETEMKYRHRIDYCHACAATILRTHSCEINEIIIPENHRDFYRYEEKEFDDCPSDQK